MARTARFTETLPPMKVTPAQYAAIHEEADSQRISLAEAVRGALDAKYGLAREQHPQDGSQG